MFANVAIANLSQGGALSGLPASYTATLMNFMVWCASQNVSAEARAAGIFTLDYGTDRVATVIPMWNNFSQFSDEELTDYQYFKLWVPVNGVRASDSAHPFLDNLPFSLSQYPAGDGDGPGSRWPSKGTLGLTITLPMAMSSEIVEFDFSAVATTGFYLVGCAELFEEQLNS